MVSPEKMTAERYRSLLSSCGISDINDVDVAIIEGPAIVPSREGRPLLVLTQEHYEQFDKVWKDI
jgi:hypothetical protein